jgi:hypothetical protein
MFVGGVNIRKEPFRDLRGPFSVQKSDMRATSAADPLATFKFRGKGKSRPQCGRRRGSTSCCDVDAPRESDRGERSVGPLLKKQICQAVMAQNFVLPIVETGVISTRLKARSRTER